MNSTRFIQAFIFSAALTNTLATQDQSSQYSCEPINTLPQHVIYGEDENWTYLADTTSTSTDGNVIATGEPGFKNERGRGVLLSRKDKDHAWTTTFIEAEPENSRFGHDVSVAGDGSLLAVGALWDGGIPPFFNSGGIYLYEVSISNVNIPFQKLTGGRPNIQNGDNFGHRVALDYAGNTLVATAPYNGGTKGEKRHIGAVEVYKRGKHREPFVFVTVVYGDHATDRLGMGGLDLSADGTVFAVGGPHARQFEDTPRDQAPGVVKVYEIKADVVTCLQEFWGATGMEVMIGRYDGVALSGTGRRLAVSHLNHGDSRGEVKFYEKQNTGYYALLGRPIEGTNAGDHLGHSINFALDGSRVVIGARKGEIAVSEYNNTGTVEVFDFNSTTRIYQRINEVFAGDFPGDNFGTAVSMSEDGSTLMVGASGYDHHNHLTNGKLSIYQTSCSKVLDSSSILSSRSNLVLKQYGNIILTPNGSSILTAFYNKSNGINDVNYIISDVQG